MVEFKKESLEVMKYTDLVKLAKEHNVFRRYAPKIELVEKLMALCESPAETLNDISMPSFMENDETGSDEGDAENTLPHEGTTECRKGSTSDSKPDKVSCSSPRVPLLDQEKNLNRHSSVFKSQSPMNKSRSGTPQSLRKSLAGPAKPAIIGKKLRRQGAFEVDDTTAASSPSVQAITRRLTRQRTFEVEEVSGLKIKREGTFEIGKGTKELETSVARTQILRREDTFEITELKTDSKEKIDNLQPHNLRREGTFEVENTSFTKKPSHGSISTSCSVSISKPRETINRLSQSKQPARTSLKSPYQLRRASAHTPSSVKTIDKNVTEQSVPRRFITSRIKPMASSPGIKSPAIKSKIPSVINQIERNKAEVSAKKVVEATAEKPILAKKIPDFSAIHKRMFSKMESLVDSRQKVIDKANSMQKSQQKFGNSKRSPPNTRVVRKLLSPKAGKSKLVGVKSRLPTPKSKIPSPKSKPPTPKSQLFVPQSKLNTPRAKAAFQHVASEYASNIVSIQKRPSIGSLIPGVSKLQSPKFEARGKSTKTHFGFTKTEPSRKEALKASIMEKKPLKRSSPMAKAKKALQTVRLNKRFELQMKHRIAQQEHGN
ncbi:uncharacterized protein LOC117650737 [Thrips palmi]|uniref:Uncharacterized protein LOC117650737 n=1 Tax=Thrips palmi TaxID=161013 RepID=A0A6P8ZZT9_THRPL|nr:uncharacterized protein LOC117650737 [Thrips palmi]